MMKDSPNPQTVQDLGFWECQVLRVQLDTTMDELVLQRAAIPEKRLQTPLDVIELT